MANSVHPILQEYIGQIPDSIQTYLSIQQGKNYGEIETHALNEMDTFKSLGGVLEDGRTVQDVASSNPPW